MHCVGNNMSGTLKIHYEKFEKFVVVLDKLSNERDRTKLSTPPKNIIFNVHNIFTGSSNQITLPQCMIVQAIVQEPFFIIVSNKKVKGSTRNQFGGVVDTSNKKDEVKN